jgi:hypothetical protein
MLVAGEMLVALLVLVALLEVTPVWRLEQASQHEVTLAMVHERGNSRQGLP